MNWTTEDIWKYIKKYNIPYPEHYNKGFDRLGCVGCPMTTVQQRIKELQIYPRYAHRILKAIEVNIKNGKSLSRFFDDPYEAFMWWLSAISVESFRKSNTTGLFKTELRGCL